MYAGFNLDVSRSYGQIPFSEFRLEGQLHLKAPQNTVRNSLRDFVLEGTNIHDGTAIQNAWFPEVKADIFISHSHKDIDLAESLAGWLHTRFGLRCFIDSNVWGYADELLELINSEYSNKRKDPTGGYLYNHESCIAASKHIDTMLTIALHKMIDRCECVFLLNTENSIQRYAALPHDATFSPWIYSEIVCSQLVRKRPLSDYRDRSILKHDGLLFEAAQENFTPAYSVTTKHLHPLNYHILSQWEKNYREKHSVCKYPLDTLYALMPEIGTDKLRELYG